MNLFISILFVLVFVLVGKSQEQINIKTGVDINCKNFINSTKSIQHTFYENVFDEQDSDDVDEFETFGTTTIPTVKPLSWKVKSELNSFLPFYQFQSNKLLIDLPPPVYSLLF